MRLKPIETRTWYTKYRGDLLLVASKRPVWDEILQCPKCYGFEIAFSFDVIGADPGNMFCPHCGKEVAPVSIDASISGQAVCIVNLVDCRPMVEDDEPKARCKIYPGAFSWVFENIRPIEPFPVKGQLHIYDVPVEVEQLKLLTAGK